MNITSITKSNTATIWNPSTAPKATLKCECRGNELHVYVRLADGSRLKEYDGCAVNYCVATRDNRTPCVKGVGSVERVETFSEACHKAVDKVRAQLNAYNEYVAQLEDDRLIAKSFELQY